MAENYLAGLVPLPPEAGGVPRPTPAVLARVRAYLRDLAARGVTPVGMHEHLCGGARVTLRAEWPGVYADFFNDQEDRLPPVGWRRRLWESLTRSRRA